MTQYLWLVNPGVLIGAACFLWREISGLRRGVQGLGERVARIEGAIDYAKRPHGIRRGRNV